MPNLSARSIDRIGRRVRAAERKPESPAIGDRRAAKAVTVRPGMLAMTTGILTARTGIPPTCTLGSGPVTLLDVTDTGVTSSSGIALTARNWAKDPIAANQLVKLALVDGLLVVDLADCPEMP